MQAIQPPSIPKPRIACQLAPPFAFRTSFRFPLSAFRFPSESSATSPFRVPRFRPFRDPHSAIRNSAMPAWLDQLLVFALIAAAVAYLWRTARRKRTAKGAPPCAGGCCPPKVPPHLKPPR